MSLGGTVAALLDRLGSGSSRAPPGREPSGTVRSERLVGASRPVSHPSWAPAFVSNKSSSVVHSGSFAVDRNHPVVGTDEVALPARSVDDISELAEIRGRSPPSPTHHAQMDFGRFGEDN